MSGQPAASASSTPPHPINEPQPGVRRLHAYDSSSAKSLCECKGKCICAPGENHGKPVEAASKIDHGELEREKLAAVQKAIDSAIERLKITDDLEKDQVFECYENISTREFAKATKNVAEWNRYKEKNPPAQVAASSRSAAKPPGLSKAERERQAERAKQDEREARLERERLARLAADSAARLTKLTNAGLDVLPASFGGNLILDDVWKEIVARYKEGDPTPFLVGSTYWAESDVTTALGVWRAWPRPSWPAMIVSISMHVAIQNKETHADGGVIAGTLDRRGWQGNFRITFDDGRSCHAHVNATPTDG